ncbi:C-C motif chemokine 14 isoform X2 [Suncus etruscus]|uniref:C-C motif chemokine 14 isoform X2 n=1 Tax=Suncus etruscus TaxID=109475 RepID=UPI00210FD50A|nr:C-C motif chemokine 14 isoform X2 [Suncus etruscus]
MQDSVVTVSLLLLFLFTTLPITLGFQTEYFSGGPYQPTECCFKFTTRVFPLYRIKSYYKTGSQCTRPGIIFITKRDYLICANPNDNWVQSHIRNLQEQQ